MPGEEAYKITWATTITNFSSYAGAFTPLGRFVHWWNFKRRGRNSNHALFSAIARFIPKKVRKNIRNGMLKLGLGHVEMISISEPTILIKKDKHF